MARRSPRQRIRRLARSFVWAKDHFAALVAPDASPDASPEECDAACGAMFAARTRLVAAVLDAVGRGLDLGPVVADAGSLIVAVAESPEDEGLGVQTHDPSVIVVAKDQVVKLGRGIARA